MNNVVGVLWQQYHDKIYGEIILGQWASNCPTSFIHYMKEHNYVCFTLF